VTEPFAALPPSAAWRHRDAREGFEIVFPRPAGAGGGVLDGHTVAVEDGVAWVVRYEIRIDDRWRTRVARVASRSVAGERHVVLESDGEGDWRTDGAPAPGLTGCLDVDLESSACTNTLPVHRLVLAVGERAEAPAVYVRAIGLEVERLEQVYERVADDTAGRSRYEYHAPADGFRCQLVYDEAGLIFDYPGLATRSS